MSHSSQVLLCLVPSVFASQEPWRFGAQGETDQQDGSPDELDTDGESPRPVSAALGCTVGHAVDQEDTEGDAKLERSGDQTSNGRGRGLGLEDRNETRCATDTEAGNGTTNTDLAVGCERRAFDGDTDHEEDDVDQTCPSETDLKDVVSIGLSCGHRRNIRD